jgi:hypothetical protein
VKRTAWSAVRSAVSNTIPGTVICYVEKYAIHTLCSVGVVTTWTGRSGVVVESAVSTTTQSTVAHSAATSVSASEEREENTA